MKRNHFETIEDTPDEVMKLLHDFWDNQSEGKIDNYELCSNFIIELHKIGWKCSYDVNGNVTDLYPIPNVLPTVKDYIYFLNQIQIKNKITNQEARKLYGKFTYVEWFKLLAT
jgi:hypothetical protein